MMSNESLKMMAESIGISNLGDDACRELAIDLAFTLKSILTVWLEHLFLKFSFLCIWFFLRMLKNLHVRAEEKPLSRQILITHWNLDLLK